MFQFRAVEVFSVLARDRLQVLHPRTRLVRRMVGSALGGWTQAAHGVPMVLEVESEEEYLDKWVDEFGRWWSRSEVHPGRWFLHDTSHGAVWWDEPR